MRIIAFGIKLKVLPVASCPSRLALPTPPPSGITSLHASHWTGRTTAFFRSLEHTKLIVAPGPLHLTFPLPGTLFSQITNCLTPSPDTGL